MSETEPTAPRGMSRTAPPAPPPHSADTIRVVENMLDKQAPDPELIARHMAPEAVAARAAREAQQRADDWAGLSRYRADNASVRGPDLVMIGDSGTEIWGLAMPDMFSASVINRGISGQTSPQILLRFMADVVDLQPRRVHILCGTNDIAGNTGPSVPEDYQRNIRAMCDLAAANGIEVLLGSLTPATTIFWQPESQPLEWVPHLNAWLRDFARTRGHHYLDYHSVLHDGEGGLREDYSADGVHVTSSAYRAMYEILAPYLG